MKFKKLNIEKTIPYWIPVILAIIQLIQSNIDSQSFYTRIDPEYTCLMNGLNIAILKFDHYGCFTWPGVPFILLTGIFFRVTHLFLGQGPIFTDVITQPELYLRSSSVFLMIVTTLILIWGGKKIYVHKKDIWGVIIIQSSFFFSDISLHLPTRYIPDRILPVYAFIFAIFTIIFIREQISQKRYAIISGIILGIGFVTKVNFLPLLIIPLFIIPRSKIKLIYLLSLTISILVLFSPIIDKFGEVKSFMLSIITHDGMYGEGEKQILNIEKLFQHISEIIHLNMSFTIINLFLILSILFIAVNSKRRKQSLKSYYLLIAIAIATIVEIIMVAKHFKGYYLTPIMGISGLTVFILWEHFLLYFQKRRSIYNSFTAIILLILIVPNIVLAAKILGHSSKKINERQITTDFINKIRKPSDWLLVEPYWQSGPLIENGLMLGISYVARREDYYDYFKENYPKVIAYEGDNKTFSQFRCGEIDEKMIMESGNDIIMTPRPGMQTQQIIDKLYDLSILYQTPISIDTIFINKDNMDMVLRARHLNR